MLIKKKKCIRSFRWVFEVLLAVFLCMGGLIMGNLLQDTVGHSDSGRSLAQHGKPMGVYKSTNKYKYTINVYIIYCIWYIFIFIYVTHMWYSADWISPANMWIFTSAAFKHWTFAKTWDGDCLWQTVIIPYRTWRFCKGGWKNSDQLFWLVSQKHCNMDPNYTQWLLCWGKNLGRTFFGGDHWQKNHWVTWVLPVRAARISSKMKARAWRIANGFGNIMVLVPAQKIERDRLGQVKSLEKSEWNIAKDLWAFCYLRGSPGRLHIYGVVQPNGWRITVEYSPAWLLNLDGVCGEIMHIYI